MHQWTSVPTSELTQSITFILHVPFILSPLNKLSELLGMKVPEIAGTDPAHWSSTGREAELSRIASILSPLQP
jgi:hypothetical protein